MLKKVKLLEKRIYLKIHSRDLKVQLQKQLVVCVIFVLVVQIRVMSLQFYSDNNKGVVKHVDCPRLSSNSGTTDDSPWVSVLSLPGLEHGVKGSSQHRNQSL